MRTATSSISRQRRRATPISTVSVGTLKVHYGQVDSTADMDLVYDVGIYEVGVQYQSAADDAASSLGQSMGF